MVANQLVEDPMRSWPFEGVVVMPVPPCPVPKGIFRVSVPVKVVVVSTTELEETLK